MAAIRIRRTLDSDTLHLPELRPLIGRSVEIVVQESPPGPAEIARVRAVLDWIAANRVTPAPGTPDSTELLREDRER